MVLMLMLIHLRLLGGNTMNKVGYFSLILHAHLPFIKHPERSDCLEERWLYEAIIESYIPLLKMLNRLSDSGVDYRIAVSLSPPLLEMLSDGLLLERFKNHLERLIILAEKEVKRNAGNEHLSLLSNMYLQFFQETDRAFKDDFQQDLVLPWSRLQKAGNVELLTSAATHGYLPLLLDDTALDAQIEVGLETFRRHFGYYPKGFWLPECAYAKKVEKPLLERGIRYTILETHGLTFASPRPKYGYHAPIKTSQGLIVFGRDPECSRQVWSADEGYPGDGRYREFHRDIGYDLEVEYLGDALPSGVRVPTGIKYHRVTHRKTPYKELYDPISAREAALTHAANFCFWRNKEAEYWSKTLKRKPIMVAPFDAELFGHWWFEGPLFLENVLRIMGSPNSPIKPISPTDYLKDSPQIQISQPTPSSWGQNGYNEVWLDGSNNWVYRHLHACQELMRKAANDQDATGMKRRALNQAARELLLAQASDWTFIMKAGHVSEYARRRLVKHLGRFMALLRQAQEDRVDPSYISAIELQDSVFPDLDYALFADK